MILSNILNPRFSPTIFLICVFIPLAIFLLMSIGMFRNDFKANNTVGKTKVMMFDEYLKKFNKSYSGDEYTKRFSNFMTALKEISRLNHITGAIHGLTKFSDMTKEEFSKILGGSRRLKNDGDIIVDCLIDKSIRIEDSMCMDYTDDLPDVVDWRKNNRVGPVLDQQKCGACWAFSTVGLVETMSLIQEIENTYTRRSIQQLIDCSENCHGCFGGNVAITLESLCKNHTAITTEDKYPLALVNQECRVSGNLEGRKIKRYWINFDLDEWKMQCYLAKHGPLAVVVNANPWMHYMGGIIQRACYHSKDKFVLDHVVQLVGYDKSGGVPYYIVRNSWGTTFGNEGYVKLVMNKNICGICDEVSRLEVY